MTHTVSHESKMVYVFSQQAPEEELQSYARKGYRMVRFLRGSEPVTDVMRGILLHRCR